MTLIQSNCWMRYKWNLTKFWGLDLVNRTISSLSISWCACWFHFVVVVHRHQQLFLVILLVSYVQLNLPCHILCCIYCFLMEISLKHMAKKYSVECSLTQGQFIIRILYLWFNLSYLQRVKHHLWMWMLFSPSSYLENRLGLLIPEAHIIPKLVLDFKLQP
jgi:hypothetical protein